VFFFLQAEDGIRDFHVTGVQTCALPICRYGSSGGLYGTTEGEYQITLTCHQPETISCGDIVTGSLDNTDYYDVYEITIPGGVSRSEERRVGKERTLATYAEG